MPSGNRVTDIVVGSELGRYRVTRRLGVGGMGEVYLADDLELERPVALKVLRHLSDEDRDRDKLLDEARSASSLNHPNICTVHSVEEVDGLAFIVMEYVDGRPLSEIVEQDPLPVETLGHYGRQIADALAHAHRHGVIHRDLKLGNVMITSDGRAKVLDFGLALRLTSAELSHSPDSRVTRDAGDSLVGTVAYMAPETLQGSQADELTDIWSLGALLYQAATAEYPFAGTTLYEVRSSILREPPKPLPAELPASLRMVITRCLTKERAHRYHSAGEVRAALETTQTTEGWAAPGQAVRRSWQRTAGWVALVSTIAGLALILLTLSKLESTAPIHRIAVLPLENRADEDIPAFLAGGATDALVTELANIGQLRVISSNSVARLVESSASPEDIARTLRVDHLVTGSLMKMGDQVRITVELLDPKPGEYLWAGSYDGELGNIFDLQAQAARAIANRIRVELTPREDARLRRSRAVDVRAYEAYLRGRHEWNQRTEQGFRRAIEHFEEAIEHEPDYALAFAGIADAFCLLGVYGYAPPDAAFPKAREAATRALAIDPNLAEVHATLGAINDSYVWDWQAAEAAYRRALDLNRSYATAAHWYGGLLAMLGRFDEALAQLEEAASLDPLSSPIHITTAMTLLYARRTDEAIARARRAIEIDPSFSWSHNLLGQAYQAKGMFDQAIEELRLGYELSGSSIFDRAELGAAYAASGRTEEALAVLAEVQEPPESIPAPSFEIAMIYAGLGRLDEAFDALERAYASRSAWMPYTKVEIRLAPLRADPRYTELLRRLELSE